MVRVQVNVKSSKLLTAKKILGVAEVLINKLKDPKHPLSIVCDEELMREGSFSSDVDILEQRLLLNQGLL